LKTIPHPYQLEDATKAYELCLDVGFFGLLYKPGMRKTYTSLMINEFMYKNGHTNALFIICPKNAIKVWKTQIPEHSELKAEWWVWESVKSKSDNYKNELRWYLTKGEYPVFIISCESLQTYNEVLMNTIQLFIKERKVFEIIDESAKFKNGRSKRTERLLSFSHTPIARGILNGTPTPKSIVDIWSQMEALKRIFWKEGSLPVFESLYSFKIFVRSWDGKKGYEKTITRSDVNDLQDKLNDLNYRSILSDKQKIFKIKLEHDIDNYNIALNRIESSLKDVQNQIAPYVFYRERDINVPPVQHIEIPFELSKEEVTVYKKLKKDLIYTNEDGEIFTMKSKGSLFQKFRQITGGAYDKNNPIVDLPSKIDAMLDDIETHEENVLIITSYRANIKSISKHLETIGPTATYFGDTSVAERDKIIDDAKSGRLRFIVANSEAIGLGVDGLQNTFHMMYVYDIPIPPLTWEQIIFRLDRSGQEYSVVVKHFLAEIDGNKTVDHRCLSLAKDKRDLQSAFEKMSDSEFEESV